MFEKASMACFGLTNNAQECKKKNNECFLVFSFFIIDEF